MVDFEQDIEQALTVLRAGGIILYPTDTIWGIGCDATQEAAVEKIIQLKQRPADKAMLVLVADEREILQYVAAPDMRLFDYLDTCTKPTTVIYENALGLAENLVAEDGSIAIRICQDAFCRHLIKRLRKPLVSTSANISGEKAPAVFPEISEQIKSGVDFIPQYRREDLSRAAASSLIKWKNGEVEIIRP